MALFLSSAAARYFGYFTEAAQTKPAYDPGREAPCPVCAVPLGDEEVVTTSLMYEDLNVCVLSLFYRMHRACRDALSDSEQQEVEWRLLDLVEA